MGRNNVIFSINLVPPSHPAGTPPEDVLRDERIRRYVAGGGRAGSGYLTYMKAENKRNGNFTEDFPPLNPGLFDYNGLISPSRLKEKKRRLRNCGGTIWYGYVAVGRMYAYLADTPGKCAAFVRAAFLPFLRESGLRPEKTDLVCALHRDRPDHYHVHFMFWEKYPHLLDWSGNLCYRQLKTLPHRAVENFRERARAYLEREAERPFNKREAVLRRLRAFSLCGGRSPDGAVRREILDLSRKVPKDRDLLSGSAEAEPFLPRVRRIISMIKDADPRVRASERRFKESLSELRASLPPESFPPEAAETYGREYERRRENAVLAACRDTGLDLLPGARGFPPACVGRGSMWLKRRSAASMRRAETLIEGFLRDFHVMCEGAERAPAALIAETGKGGREAAFETFKGIEKGGKTK